MEMSENTNEFKHGVCDCCHKASTCLFGCFCDPCLMCQNADRLGEEKWLYCLLYCCLPFGAMTLLRGKAREKYGIEGSTVSDLVVSLFCGPCVNCQIANELDEQEGK